MTEWRVKGECGSVKGENIIKTSLTPNELDLQHATFIMFIYVYIFFNNNLSSIYTYIYFNNNLSTNQF